MTFYVYEMVSDEYGEPMEFKTRKEARDFAEQICGNDAMVIQD